MDKEMKNGKKKLIITMAVALILIVGVTVSYGYIALVSSSKNQELSVGTGDIHLELDDADSGSVEANLNLGGSITKTLKITNKGTKPGKVQINWKNLINTYNSRSLSYTLETSSNKTSGYTKVEALRENVPVSTEAKEVPLSKELTIPVGSNPIYYRVTITFNDLEDVDQESDLSATLITQFSLSEPENLSKKVIAVLDGNVKSGDPDLINPSPKYIFKAFRNGINTREITSEQLENNYVYYGDDYEIDNKGKFNIKNPQVAKYKDTYTNLVGKYLCRPGTLTSDSNELVSFCSSRGTIYQVKSSFTTQFKYESIDIEQEVNEPKEYSYQDTYNIGSNSSKTIYYSDSYTFNGLEFELVNPKSCTYSSCYQNLVGKYTVDLYPDDNAEQISYEYGTSLCKIESASLTSISFNSKFNTEGEKIIDYSTSGVYTAEDDYGTSYYYRGGVTNNHFKFGGYYWRIIRVNGDGSIRLSFAGTKAHSNGESADITDNSISSIYLTTSSIKTAGYMVGVDESSDKISASKQEADTNTYNSELKSKIDAWYETNLKVNAANGNSDLGTYLSDTLFCSDRSVASEAGLWSSNDTALGYGNNQTIYGSHYRLENGTPSLKCPLKNDRFTVSDKTIGNGALKYKIATINADELMMAGLTSNGSVSTGQDYLHIHSYGTYSMSPGRLYPGSTKPSLYNLNRLSSYILASNLSNMRAIPVINIDSEYGLKVIGNGTMTDPFMIPGVN